MVIIIPSFFNCFHIITLLNVYTYDAALVGWLACDRCVCVFVLQQRFIHGSSVILESHASRKSLRNHGNGNIDGTGGSGNLGMFETPPEADFETETNSQTIVLHFELHCLPN